MAFGIDVRIYGKLDDSARVLVFNHPDIIDTFIAGSIVGPSKALMSSRHVFSQLLRHIFGFVVVSPNGGEQTTERVLESLEQDRDKHRFLIAANRPDMQAGGRTPGDRIDCFKTVAFRLGEAVQPMVIVYDTPPYSGGFNMLRVFRYVFTPISSQKRARVYLLPKMTRRKKETPELFAERVKRRMNRCLELAWMCAAHKAPERDTSCMHTSMLFTTVVVSCIAKGLYAYALLWAALTCTSLLYHTCCTTDYKIADRFATFLVTATGMYYMVRHLKPSTRIIPLLGFLGVVVVQLFHWPRALVHLFLLVGHHAIVRAVPY